ncbi:hypothetical protein SSX86_002707 [Deinandra increscens subsp. villosa]|uniref:TSL-kinase interacting protein 1 n=1 Tax=Deinandra increscens subsp. villosa TaxID=3103831 RepID=A0AAP0DST3_9ASTR
MNMESQVSCRDTSDLPENVFIKDVITSETHHVPSDQPAKKQTRQWAAWTRQEEESFFNALRQVGKASLHNFEKITARVQSKNKDQVRHYYYRLVRRMNKLLAPELSLDAKNSKDTNAAMLRWWSLLEKCSCKASKLHLKPRRFKVFLETLERQLLKDRKKSIKKRPFQGENVSTTPSHGVSNQNNCKGDLSPIKQSRQKRRSGSTSTAAYKKWEKAAIAGVSLVADAAAHLEQTALDTLVDGVQFMQEDIAAPRNIPPVPPFHQTVFTTNTMQPLTKLKLQLFPINESLRRALEMDNHNPHLELILSSRKKISSVLERINHKWGNCNIASGELMLLPYHAQSSNLITCQKWTQDSVLSAADVYAAIGSPPVFRLRYGWFVIPPQEPQPIAAPQRLNMNSVEGKGSQKNAGVVSVLEWADSLTNISVSDLLSDVNNSNSNININNNSNSKKNANGSIGTLGSQCAFSCDSFDAAIAAHISKTIGNNTGVQNTAACSSIWDAEETCDAFTFRKNNVLPEKAQTSKENCKEDTNAMGLVPSTSAIEKLPEAEEPMENCPAEIESMEECRSDDNPEDASAKDLQALTDIYWPDSLGTLEVGLPPCRYQSNDLILSESLGGLTRFLANSIDAFQNSCLFGLEQRVGDREPAPVNIVP